ncbi:hypothetical protein MKX03_000901 [Papaver bracteatum]|nr:hypothetical protein MKX03_000901 [Papaver bracteatum]
MSSQLQQFGQQKTIQQTAKSPQLSSGSTPQVTDSYVSGSHGDDASWSSWFCNLRGHEFLFEVDNEYIQDDFKFCGLSEIFTEDQHELVESAAEMLLKIEILQLEKYKNYHSGRFPRVHCSGQPCLPVVRSDIPGIDRADFGTTFPHLFLMIYGHLTPQKASQSYIQRIFGFKIHRP